VELFVLSDISKKNDILVNDHDPYQDQVQRLEREVARLQGELAQVRRKEGRSRTVASLVCQLYGSLQPQTTMQEIGPLFLNLLTKALHIERAALLTHLADENLFLVQHARGFSPPVNYLSVADNFLQEFACTNGPVSGDPFWGKMEGFIGLSSLLWSYKKDKNTALLLGNSRENRADYPFDQDDQEVVESMLNVFIEIIARKRAEKELRLAEEVFAGSVEGTIITDADFRVLRVNAAFTRITEYQPHEVVGKTLSWLKDEEFVRQIIVSLDEQDHWRGEFRDVSKSGIAYVSWLNISSVKNAQGEVTDYIMAFLDITQEKFREEAADRYLKELNSAYRRFVPQRLLEYLEKPSIIDIELGNHVERSMTVLFSDLVDFTRLSESISPAENFRFINSYLSVMEPVIADHNGFIDKYIGDAVMALFDGKADDALRAAIAMQRMLVTYNEGRGRAGYQPIKTSIGINTGLLMLGTVGSPKRMEGTVISDAVNVAARIEGVNKIYSTSLLIGEGTYRSLERPEDFALRRIDQFKAKGKSKTVTVYEVFETDPPEVRDAKLATLNLFIQAVYHYHIGQFLDAKQIFNECVSKCKQDQVARYYLDCCERHLNIEVSRW
jgi:PAS domain S-box-containing protein